MLYHLINKVLNFQKRERDHTLAIMNLKIEFFNNKMYFRLRPDTLIFEVSDTWVHTVFKPISLASSEFNYS